MKLPETVLYYGKNELLLEKTLRAAPLPLIYEAGDLRYTKRGNYPANPQGEIPKESDGAGSRTLTLNWGRRSQPRPAAYGKGD
jgi:hypothetical protein